MTRWQKFKARSKTVYKWAAASSKVDFTLADTSLSSFWGKAMSSSTASADLQTELKKIIDLLPPDDVIDDFARQLKGPSALDLAPKIKQEANLIRDQAVDFYSRLADSIDMQLQGLPTGVVPQKQGTKPEASGTPWWDLAFLDIRSHAIEGNASVTVTPLIASLKTAVTGKLKRTAYRYQTFALEQRRNRTLVYTQDTAIVYRQAAMTAEAKAKLVLTLKKVVVLPASMKNFVVNDLTYQSIGVYWLYPTNIGARPDTVKTQMGSGLSYGVSVNTDDLVALLADAKESQANPDPDNVSGLTPAYARIVETLADYLQIPSGTLIAFLVAIPAVKQTNWAKKKSLLIEASYLFKPLDLPTKVSENEDGPLCELRGLWENDPSSNCVAFDALRSRVADHRESKHYFRLETKYVAEFGIALSEIKEAGTQSILDLHTQFFNGKDYETAVPPVALFHQ